MRSFGSLKCFKSDNNTQLIKRNYRNEQIKTIPGVTGNIMSRKVPVYRNVVVPPSINNIVGYHQFYSATENRTDKFHAAGNSGNTL
jgi:hypothetical protein